MRAIIRPLGVSVFLGCAVLASAQEASGPKIDRINIKYVGPHSVSEEFIRANIKLKPGATYLPGSTQDDVHSLYNTGQFYNINVSVEPADDGGVVLTYQVQPRPRISEIRIEGADELSRNKVEKKITVKAGEPLDEQKLFTDVQDIKRLYEKYGLADTQVKYVLDIDSNTGRGVVTFQIKEAKKVEITEVDFLGAKAFPQDKLRKEIKTRRRWMFSWITGSGYFKQDEFDSDREALTDFYHKHGYLDFQIKDVKRVYPTPTTMVIKYYVFEGQQYKVGSVKITGGKIYPDAEIVKGLEDIHNYEHLKTKLGPNGLPMDVGDVYTPGGMMNDMQAIQDFYGSRGYIDIAQGQALRVIRIPNVETGTMDLEFNLADSQKTYVQKIDIRGNIKTKDKVIRRELTISPGEVFNMVKVKMSKSRLEQMQYFDKVEMDPEPTDPPIPGRKDLVVNVEETHTGHFTVGAGVESDSGLVGYVTVEQSNFDPFKPPYFTGGGQRIRLYVAEGTEQQDYELNYTQPWFMDKKITLGIDLYRRVLYYESPNDIYNETRTGANISLSRTLWSDSFIGSVHNTIEQVGIQLNDGWYGPTSGSSQNVPDAISGQTGVHLFERVGGSLAYDTRNSVQLPNHGQRTDLALEYSDELTKGNNSYYKLDLTSAWYFPGLFKGHVIEIGGRVAVADGLSGGDVPFYDRLYLGGVYSLRGFKYRNVAPRDPNYGNPAFPSMSDEPVGGDTLWFGSIEYSLPIFEKGNVSLRFALFYDIGAIGVDPYSFNSHYDDNWGVGIRLNIPRLGPLRLDYGVPITHDKFNSASGHFQFSFGYERPF